jgi:MFS family permease
MMAILLAVVLIPLNVLFQRQRPQDMGLMPDGDTVPGPTESGTAAPSNIVDPDWAAVEWTVGKAVRTARYWWVFAGFFSALFAWYAVQVHQTKYLIESGFDPGQAAYALGWVGLTGIVGQIVLGHLSDRFGREWAWTAAELGFVACCTALLLLPRYPTAIMMYIVVASQGVLGYGLTSVMGAIPAELFQGKRYGTIFGTLSLGASLGAASGPWLTGVIYDRTSSYAPAWWIALGLCLFSALCMWIAAPRRVRVVAGQIERLHARPS